jgi:hypothetical protein
MSLLRHCARNYVKQLKHDHQDHHLVQQQYKVHISFFFFFEKIHSVPAINYLSLISAYICLKFLIKYCKKFEMITFIIKFYDLFNEKSFRIRKLKIFVILWLKKKKLFFGALLFVCSSSTIYFTVITIWLIYWFLCI